MKHSIQKEIVDSIQRNAHGRLLLAPRIGKTKIVIDLIKRDKPKSILWVSPSVQLLNVDLLNEFIKWKAKRYIKKLTTVTWASLHKQTGVFDLIVLDEDQHITENNIINLLNRKLEGRIISMTGVPTKHEDKHELYNFLGLKPLYSIDINNAVDMGVLSNYIVKVLQVDMDTRKNIKIQYNGNSSFMTSEFNQYQYKTKVMKEAINSNSLDKKFRILDRMRTIKNSPSKLQMARELRVRLNGRKLFFCATIKQAEAVSKYTYHSKTNDTYLQLFLNGKIDTIAMVNAGGTGFTYKEIDHLIMVQADSDKNGLTSQKICRTLLAQKDYKATVWIISLNDTQDWKWVTKALENFDSSKVKIYNTNINI